MKIKKKALRLSHCTPGLALDAKSLAVENVYLAGSLIASREFNWSTGTFVTKYQHTDALGRPVAVTSAAGQVTERTDWEPYGAAIGKSSYEGIGFSGHVQDAATGLGAIACRASRALPDLRKALTQTEPVRSDFEPLVLSPSVSPYEEIERAIARIEHARSCNVAG